jgi:hypothetical protein
MSCFRFSLIIEIVNTVVKISEAYGVTPLVRYLIMYREQKV